MFCSSNISLGRFEADVLHNDHHIGDHLKLMNLQGVLRLPVLSGVTLLRK